jgi:hypothetical protein
VNFCKAFSIVLIVFIIAGTGRPAAAAVPLPHPISITTFTSGTSCGPYYSYSSPITLYCGMFAFSGTCTAMVTPSQYAVGGSGFPVGSGSAYLANAGLPTQFLNVTWDSADFYVASLVPVTASVTLIVWC